MRIFSTAPIPPVAHRLFEPLGAVELLDQERSGLEHAELLLVRAERITAEDLERATALRAIARTGSGVDKVDVDAATARRIPVLYAPGAGAQPVAEGTIALVLAAAKRLGELGSVVREGRWAARYDVDVLDLHGAVLGIVGYGRIGQEVGRLARGLGMSVIAHDPLLGAGSEPAENGVELMPLLEVARRCDVLTLHCPLTEDTRGLIDRDVIASMRRGSVLVNVARGEIVAGDELLAQALADGHLKAVAVDVFGTEPPALDSPLLGDPRVVCSPHSIGLTHNWNQRIFGTLAEDVRRYLAGEAPIYVVDPAALALPSA